jgi:Tfp pilus assembly protein PilF
VDAEVGRLRAALETRAVLENAIVVVTSDHGEGRGEHGEETHGAFLYQSTLHVPLLVWAPGRWPSGHRVSTTVSLADVAPTLLDLAGLPPPGGVDGRSLDTVLKGDVPASWLPLETEFGWNSYGWAPLVGLTDGRLKWVGAPRPELYDLTEDPTEQADLSGDKEAEVRRLKDLWRERVTEDRRERPLRGDPDREDAEQLERLKALGYVAGSAAPAPGDTSALPDPKDAIASLALVNEARALIGKGRQRQAQSVLERALKSSPRNVSALTLLGISHIVAGQPRRAIDPLERAARLAPANADVQFNLGLAQAGVGSVPGAEGAFRRAVTLAPRNHDAAVSLVDLLVNTGRLEEGWKTLQGARKAGLESPQLDFLEGKLAAARGDRERARVLLERSLSGGLPAAAAEQARALLRSLG